MKRNILVNVVLTAGLTTFGALSSLAAVEPQGHGQAAPTAADAKVIAGDFLKRLKGAMQEGISKGGPVAAIGVCSEQAMQMGAEAARQSGWSVRRVSTRTRNPLNLPDGYELGVLGEFEKAIAGGKVGPERFEVVTEGGVRYARFVKAIRIEQPCLACHGGKEVAPGTEEKLRALYPHDTARHYAVGDLRGALSMKMKID